LIHGGDAAGDISHPSLESRFLGAFRPLLQLRGNLSTGTLKLLELVGQLAALRFESLVDR
jgi:hypothetical protein